MGVDLRSNAIDTSHALRGSERATPQSVPPNLKRLASRQANIKVSGQLNV